MVSFPCSPVRSVALVHLLVTGVAAPIGGSGCAPSTIGTPGDGDGGDDADGDGDGGGDGGLPTGEPAPRLMTILQGQSNAVLLLEDGYRSIYQGLVADLTGIPEHLAEGVRSDQSDVASGYTLASGTPTFAIDTVDHSLWLDPHGDGADVDDPATWPEGDHGVALHNWIGGHLPGDFGDGVPVVFVRMHGEYDSKLSAGEIAQYPAANRELVRRVRERAGKPAAEMPVFYAHPTFWSGSNDDAFRGIREAWRRDVADPAMNAAWGYGYVSDADDLGDASHWDGAGSRQAAGRLAFAVARWLGDRGYAHTDLDFLPGLGPQIARVRRVAGRADALDLVVEHDRGTDLVVPDGVATGSFSVSDAGASREVTAIERVDATTLRLTLSGSLTGDDGEITVDHGLWVGFYGPGSAVTDDWHTDAVDKPAWTADVEGFADVRFPLRRLDRPLAVGR